LRKEKKSILFFSNDMKEKEKTGGGRLDFAGGKEPEKRKDNGISLKTEDEDQRGKDRRLKTRSRKLGIEGGAGLFIPRFTAVEKRRGYPKRKKGEFSPSEQEIEDRRYSRLRGDSFVKKGGGLVRKKKRRFKRGGDGKRREKTRLEELSALLRGRNFPFFLKTRQDKTTTGPRMRRKRKKQRGDRGKRVKQVTKKKEAFTSEGA